MPVLDCPVRKEDWIREVGERNSAAVSHAKRSPTKPLRDAGAWEPTIQQIVAYQRLEDDWDGLGAQAPLRELLESVLGLAYLFWQRGVDPPHAVAPGVNGTVLMEWQEQDGTYRE